MRVVSSAAMQEIDRRAREEYGIPGLVLMESAGLQAWQELRRRAPGVCSGGRRVCIVAGKGNNGGDALVMARYAVGDGCRVTVVLAAPFAKLGEQARLHANTVRALGVDLLVWAEHEDRCRDALRGASLVVDGLAGTGINGALRDPLDAIAGAVNDSGVPVAAVDAPSGLGDTWTGSMPVVRSRWTLTMGLPKTCLYTPRSRPHCGEIIPVAVPFPPALVDDPAIEGSLIGPDDLGALLPPLASDAYKHRRGVVAVFAGSVGTTGAAVLAAEGAMRCRAGLVTVYADREIYPIVASSARSVMVRPCDSSDDADEAGEVVTSAGTDAVVIGPGWGRSAARTAHLLDLVERVRRGVIDADGLNILAASGERPRLGPNWVLTPHPGELARLLGTDTASIGDRFVAAALEVARDCGAVVVAKSNVSVVARPDGRFALVDGSNPAMGTGGSGDVLAGAIGGLLAGGMTGFDAACAAVVAHQEAGRRLRERSGIFLADELAAELGRVADTRGA